MNSTLLAVICFVLTLVCYFLSKKLYRRYKKLYFAPIILAPSLIVVIVLSFGISLPSYFQYSHFLVMMLTPAMIAFAVPIYRERALIKQYPLTLSLGVLSGLFLGLISSWLLPKFISMPTEISHSLMVRTVSTPFAIEATTSFGGIPELTAMLVVVTGIIGILIGEPLFKLTRVKTPLAKGIALGSSAHGAGTAKATEIGKQEGVIASLTMIFTGVAMVIGAPFFAWVLQ